MSADEAMSGETGPLLSVETLSVDLDVAAGPPRRVLRNVSFGLSPGETIGLVGESGCGKSLTALSIVRLLPSAGRIVGGRILLAGRDLVRLSESEMRGVRGGRIGLVFQEPMTALNPVFTIGFQIAEAVRLHQNISRRAARRRTLELLEQVSISNPERRIGAYPHQLSGGQRQRVLLAMALAAEPDILVADEPTTALDVTVQAQILDLIARLQNELDLAVMLITHDLGIVAGRCDRVLVMYAGQIVEQARVGEFFEQPAHPYSRALLAAVPVLGRSVERGCLPTIPGRVPDFGSLPEGCAFHPRCSEAFARCAAEEPTLYDVSAGGPPSESRRARCFLWDGDGLDGNP